MPARVDINYMNRSENACDAVWEIRSTQKKNDAHGKNAKGIIVGDVVENWRMTFSDNNNHHRQREHETMVHPSRP